MSHSDEPRLHRRRVHRVHVLVEQPAPPQLAEDRRDAAGPVHVLHVVVRVRRHLGQARHPPRQRVDVGQGEVDLALLRGGEDVQHRVGGAAHRDVERHRVLERLAVRDRRAAAPRRRPRRTSACASAITVRPASRNSSRRAAWVASVEPLPGSASPSASVRQFIELAVNMPEHEPQVGQAERSTSARPVVVDLRRRGRGDRRDQVGGRLRHAVDDHGLAGLHRPAGDEHRGDVEPHRRVEHARA